MIRGAALLAAVLLQPAVTGGAEPPPRTLGALVSPTTAYHTALAQVCLPLIADSRPIGDVERDAHLVRVGSGVVHAAAADRVYRLPVVSQAYAVAWGDGSCSVMSADGDPAGFRDAAASVLAGRAEGFAPGRTDVTSVGQDRSVFCAASRPRPVVVTVATRRPGERLNAVSTTVFRSHEDDPAVCRP